MTGRGGELAVWRAYRKARALDTQPGPFCMLLLRRYVTSLFCLILSVAPVGATVALFGTLVLCTVLLSRGSQQKRDVTTCYIPLGVS